MRPSPKPVLPSDEPHKPAKERIAAAADRLFRAHGFDVGLRRIAQLAHTQEVYVRKYYGSLQQLQFIFLTSLFKEMDETWRDAEKDHPDDPEAQLRCWIFLIQIQSGDFFSPQWQLSRVTAQLASPFQEALKLSIDRYRQAERGRIADKCKQAKLRDPVELADKIILLIEGARNERGSYGFRGPLDKLGAAADDLMVAHGATRKLPMMTLRIDLGEIICRRIVRKLARKAARKVVRKLIRPIARARSRCSRPIRSKRFWPSADQEAGW